MSNDATMTDKILRLRALADELSAHIERSMEGAVSAVAATRKRFDCGDYTCHGHFTCSSFGCGSNFKLAD